MTTRTKKIGPSDSFIMNGISYKDLIEIYNFKKSQIKKIEPKEKKRIINHPIFCYANGVAHESLCDALRAHNISLDKKTSPWYKINRELKKHREYQFGEVKFELPNEEVVIG